MDTLTALVIVVGVPLVFVLGLRALLSSLFGGAKRGANAAKAAVKPAAAVGSGWQNFLGGLVLAAAGYFLTTLGDATIGGAGILLAIVGVVVMFRGAKKGGT